MTDHGGRLPQADAELWGLVEAVVAGSPTPVELDRLQARLRAEPDARLFYVAYLDLHACLQWQTRGAAARPEPSVRPAPRRRFARWLSVAASIAVACGVLVAVLLLRPSDEPEAPDLPGAPAGSVAVLIDKTGAVWDEGTALPTRTGAPLSPGRLRLKAGVAEVAFHGGGEVLLEGPTEFEVTAADRGFLHRGKLTARVPDGASAFRVGLPGLMTRIEGECGLLQEAGRTEVHVFEGRVGAESEEGPGKPLPEVRLAANTGTRIDHRTVLSVPLDAHAFERLRPEVWVSDTSVRAGQYSGQNFGTATRLMVKNSIPDYTWETYLRFDLSGVRGRVGEARVRLVPVRVGQPVENAAAQVTDDPWGETALTWDARPASGPAFATWTAREGEPVEFDVTQLVCDALAGDRRLSLRIFAPQRKRGSSYVQYGSREGEIESRPQLLITTTPDQRAFHGLPHRTALAFLRGPTAGGW